METQDFFRLDQLQWYQDFVDQEVNAILQDTDPQIEFFEFDDVPL
jgi:hypothetical protein